MSGLSKGIYFSAIYTYWFSPVPGIPVLKVKYPRRATISTKQFVIGFALTTIDFNIVWRYFAWSNQTLAMIVLWAAAMYLYVKDQTHWIATVPATFMSAVSITYILVAPEGFKLSPAIAYPAGIIVAASFLMLFLKVASQKKRVGTPKESMQKAA